MTKLYGIPNCDTMKKARKWLDANSVDYEFHDYKKMGIDVATLKQWSKQADWEVLLNRRGTTWKKLPEAERDGITKTKALSLMSENPSMIKRPVLIHNDEMRVGFKEEEYTALFG